MKNITEFFSILWLILTILLYIFNKYLYARYKKWWLMPMIFTPLIIIILIKILHSNVDEYFLDAKWLVRMLGPATIAFAVPIYSYRQLIYKYYIIIICGVITGVTISVLTSIMLANILDISDDLKYSMLTHSVSTPFAYMVSPNLGGEANLAGIFVLITGLFGMFAGHLVLALLPVKSKMAVGIFYGASAHAMGTVKAMEIGKKEGVLASLVMILTGIFIVMIQPLLIGLIYN